MVGILKNAGWYLICLLRASVIASNASFDFVFAFLQPQDDEMRGSFPYLLITTASANPVNVSISVPGISFSRSSVISHKSIGNISLPDNIYLTSEGRNRDKTIIIRSEVQISVNAMYIYLHYRSTGFSVLPTALLGQEYFVSSYTPDSSQWSEFAITALEERTQISIENVSQGTRSDMTLEPYESYQQKSRDDLTGTRISADKLVSVMSGSTGSHVGSQAGGPEYMVQHLLSVDRLGTRYILSPFLYRTSGYAFRVIATEEQTVIEISSKGSIASPVPLATSGNFHEHDEGDSNLTTTIVSNKPVLVAQFAKSHHSDARGDTLMLIVPPMPGRELGEISFPVTNLSTKSVQHSYISLTTACSNSGSFTLDGEHVTDWDILQDSMQTPFYCVLRRRVPLGVHKIGTLQPNIRYEAVVYGFGLHYVAYAFSLLAVPQPHSPNEQAGSVEGLTVICENSQMALYLNSTYIEPGHFRDVHLIDVSCTGEVHDNSTIRIVSDFNDCGTTMVVQDTSVVFHNKLIYKAPRNQNISGEVPRYFDLNFKLTCTVPRRGNSTFGSFIGPINADGAGFGHLSFSLQVFNDSNYSNPYGSKDFPIMIDDGQTIFLAASVSNVNDLKLSLEFCRITPSKDPDDTLQHVILEHGCGKYHPVTFYESPNVSQQRFSTSIDSYFTNQPLMFIHCSMIVCSKNDTSYCPSKTNDCPPRVARSISTRNSPSILKVTVSTSGPLLINSPEIHLNIQNSTKRSVILAAVGGLSLFLALLMIIGVVLKKVLHRSPSSYYALNEEFELEEIDETIDVGSSGYMPLRA